MRPEPWQRVIRQCRAAGILAAGLVASLSAATISGTVVARDGDRVEPLFRAEVIAREGGSAEIAAVARTDREGRFLISGVSTSRIALSVQKSRYFTASANGREGDSLTLDCSVPADCSDVRFEMGLGGVVSGMVRDEFGEPVAMAMVTANPPDQGQGQRGPFWGPMRGRGGRAMTDERGYFRLFGLQPGPYMLKAEVPDRGPTSGRGFEGEPVDIEVEEARELHGIFIGGRRSEGSRTFTVSGKLSGVEFSGGFGFILVRSLSSESRFGGFSTGSSVQPEGSFTLPSLDAGRYALSYVGGANRPMWGGDNGVPLGTLDVQGDLTGIVLKPLPPTGFSGVLQFESGSKPEEIQVRAWMGESWTPFHATAKAPDYAFEMTNLHPGTYRLEIGERGRGIVRGRESGELFLRGMRRGTEIAPARDIVLVEGRVEEVELLISNEFSRVHGQVKAAAGDAAGGRIQGAQFQVGISGPGGFRAMQADQNGRFDFDRIVPGEYRICAWSAPDALAIYDEKAWAAAGGAVRKFSVDAGSEVEIDLTAAP